MSHHEPAASPRWFEHRDEAGRHEYAYRFRHIAGRGEDIDGEARFVDAMAERGAEILDAGCGVGRVAAALAAAGHHAVGVDVDPILIGKGREFYPGLPLAEMDLAEVTTESLTDRGLPAAYDLIVCAGNVMHFVGPATEARIVANLTSVLKPGGRMAFGFFTGREFTDDHLDELAAAAGLAREHRFATWNLDAFTDEADWAVSVYRR